MVQAQMMGPVITSIKGSVKNFVYSYGYCLSSK